MKEGLLNDKESYSLETASYNHVENSPLEEYFISVMINNFDSFSESILLMSEENVDITIMTKIANKMDKWLQEFANSSQMKSVIGFAKQHEGRIYLLVDCLSSISSTEEKKKFISDIREMMADVKIDNIKKIIY